MIIALGMIIIIYGSQFDCFVLCKCNATKCTIKFSVTNSVIFLSLDSYNSLKLILNIFRSKFSYEIVGSIHDYKSGWQWGYPNWWK
jgi:hypothetical protein